MLSAPRVPGLCGGRCCQLSLLGGPWEPSGDRLRCERLVTICPVCAEPQRQCCTCLDPNTQDWVCLEGRPQGADEMPCETSCHGVGWAPHQDLCWHSWHQSSAFVPHPHSPEAEAACCLLGQPFCIGQFSARLLAFSTRKLWPCASSERFFAIKAALIPQQFAGLSFSSSPGCFPSALLSASLKVWSFSQKSWWFFFPPCPWPIPSTGYMTGDFFSPLAFLFPEAWPGRSRGWALTEHLHISGSRIFLWILYHDFRPWIVFYTGGCKCCYGTFFTSLPEPLFLLEGALIG